MKITLLDAEKAAQAIGINFATEKFNAYDLMVGMEVELEHGTTNVQTNVTNDDLIMTAKIALAHLRELPDYYERLEYMEKKDFLGSVGTTNGVFSKIIWAIIVVIIIIIIYWISQKEYFCLPCSIPRRRI